MTHSSFTSVSRLTRWFAAPLFAAASLGLVAGCMDHQTPPSPEQSPNSPDTKSKGTGGPAMPNKVDSSGSSSVTPSPVGPASPADANNKNPNVMSKGTGSPATPVASTPGMEAKMGPDFKDATHKLAADAPFYSTMPDSASKPEGWWKAGTPVLLTTPTMPFSKVKAGDGTEAYVGTSNLEPKSNK